MVQLFSIIRATADDDLYFVEVGKDGELIWSQVVLLGYSNDTSAFPPNLESFVGNRPGTRAWYGRSYNEYWWQGEYEHRNKTSGACYCGQRNCRRLGIYGQTDVRVVERVQQSGNERMIWLRKVEIGKAKARAYNEARKAAKLKGSV